MNMYTGISYYLFAGFVILTGGCQTKDFRAAPVATHWDVISKSDNRQAYWPLFAVDSRVKNSAVNTEIVRKTRAALSGSPQDIATLIQLSAERKPSAFDNEKGDSVDYVLYIALKVGDERFASALGKG